MAGGRGLHCGTCRAVGRVQLLGDHVSSYRRDACKPSSCQQDRKGNAAPDGGGRTCPGPISQAGMFSAPAS